MIRTSRLAAVCSLTLLGCLAPRVGAQSTQAKLDSAIALYQKFEIEAARPLLQAVLSPTWLYPITQEQRVTAYKYLGASYASIGKRDTAQIYFTAALAYDAFTDLDRNAFSPQELNAFDQAKTQIYRVGIRPVAAAKIVDPKSVSADTSQYSFRITTTQRSEVSIIAALKKPGSTGDSLTEEIFRGTNDGTRDIPWRGTINGQIAPPGNYEIRMTGTDPHAGAAPVSDKLDLVLKHSFETLEDTLPSLGATDTLVSVYPSSAPLRDLITGVAIGTAAFAIPTIALDKNAISSPDRGTWSTHTIIISAASISAGVGAFSYRRNHLLKEDAVAENLRRRNVRAQFNAGVRQRNAARLAATKLIIRPR